MEGMLELSDQEFKTTIINMKVSCAGSSIGSGRWEMADYLISISGTKKDKVNCSFYFKIGVCPHGDRSAQSHNKPTRPLLA
ncbi:hypothetical protein J1605_000112 [Eschrichtius robustus]|uniref:C3H1-type domain-containing protein n=1 Tax=Eschrichtius robustus TaxID=9764 RepID=A0AB34HNU4_ESCRO|nr:hypothetical protein J1605_000112 [Eschrichtius robustus]